MNQPRTSEELNVVLGAGQIGTLVVERLLARGARVRQVRRGPSGPARAGLEQRSGDLSDAAFARAALAGAGVVYHCLNPRYDEWAKKLLPLTRGVLAGVAASGARLVQLDCLYMYGRPAGPMREDAPLAPCSRKGELRARQSEELLAAHARGDARIAIARASDFFGPGIETALFGERFWPAALAGRPVEVFGDIDQPHSYSYSEDVADGLVTLGAHEDASGQVWHLPAAPALSTRVMIERIFAALGAGAPRYRRLGDGLLRTLGLVMPMLRELAEMTYQWKLPYVIDDARFRARFGAVATPVETQIARAVAWARAAYAPGAASAPLAAVLRR